MSTQSIYFCDEIRHMINFIRSLGGLGLGWVGLEGMGVGFCFVRIIYNTNAIVAMRNNSFIGTP